MDANSFPYGVSGIYRITCTTTGKFYIGSAVNLYKRQDTHSYYLHRNAHHNPKLQASWNKYGEAAFIFEIVELVLIPELLTAREQYWLDTLKPFGIRGFNIARIAGSSRGVKRSAETCKKIGDAHRGRKPSPEAREKNRQAQIGKHSEYNRGKKASPETRAKMSATRRGRPAHNRGTKHTPEAIEKIRLAGLGHTHSAESRAKMSDAGKVRQAGKRKTLIVTSPEGIEYTIVGIRAFCRDHHLDRSTLIRVAKGQEPHHKGWKARYP
jgi:group I intron endonuclease